MIEQKIIITLPDGSEKEFQAGVTAMDIAADIGPGLAKSTVAAQVDGEFVDACDPILQNADIRIITSRDPDGVDIIRHSCAHLLGHAVKQLYPTAQIVIGPVIENGFYYDIAYERPFTPDDLNQIEERMKQLIATNYDVVKQVLSRDEVIKTFQGRQEAY